MRKRSLSRDTIRWQKMMRARIDRRYPMQQQNFTTPQRNVSRIPYGNAVSYNPQKRHFSGFKYFAVAIVLIVIWINI